MHLALNFQRVDPARGGAETYVADLCRNLVAAGHRVDLYAETWADGCLPPQVNVVPVSAPGKNRLDRILRFARNSETALRQTYHDCSIGFVNTWAQDVIIPQGGVHRASLNANARRFPTVLRPFYLLGKNANPKHWLHRFIEARQYDPKRRPRVVAVSNMVKRDIKEYHRVSPRQIHVVPNAIDPRRLAVSQPGAVRCAFRNRFGLEPGHLVGLFVGHNFALKGLKPLLAALGARRAQHPGARPIHLLVCGNGERGPYQRLANRLGLAGTVHFLGFHPEVQSCYWSSDFFVQPTYYDPCSLVVLEALACGLPVITSAQNGASELMSSGREGYILSSADAQGELLSALDQMSDDATRRAMSIQATRLGQEQTFDTHVARLITIFEEAAASKGRSLPHSHQGGLKKYTVHFDRSRKARR
jgi:UDP-glucose:(heptosyl)LPS alpha-1,3-glucosyltransferase